jgi:hypothetical protein
VAEGVLDTLDELCAGGPTEAELEHDRESLREDSDDPETWVDGALQAAVERVAGIPGTAHETARVLAGLRPDAVAAALREVRDSLVLGLPEGQRLDRLPPLPACPTPPVTGRVLARALRGSHEDRGARLVLGANGITVHPDRAAEPLTVLFDDVVGVGVDQGPTGRPDDEVLYASAGSGDVLVLRARNWRGGAAAVAALRAAVPAELFYRVPERIGD